jgi:hypothetical protein
VQKSAQEFERKGDRECGSRRLRVKGRTLKENEVSNAPTGSGQAPTLENAERAERKEKTTRALKLVEFQIGNCWCTPRQFSQEWQTKEISRGNVPVLWYDQLGRLPSEGRVRRTAWPEGMALRGRR